MYVLAAPETNLDNLDVDNFLTAPAIMLCIIGGLLFLLGFCGCLGALLELYFLLIAVPVCISSHPEIIMDTTYSTLLYFQFWC